MMRLRTGLLVGTFGLALLFSSCQKLADIIDNYNGGGDITEDVFNVPSGNIGDILWTYEYSNSGMHFVGDPAFDKERQVVYVCAEPKPGSSAGNARIIAINGNSTLKWESTAGDFTTGSCPVIGKDGTVYYYGLHQIFALSPSDGAILWTYTISDREIENLYYHPEGRIIVICGGTKGGMAIIAEDGKSIDDTLEGAVDFYQAVAIMPNNNIVMQIEGQAPDGIYFKWLVRKSVGLTEVWRVSLDSFALVGENIPVANNNDIFMPQVSAGNNGIVEVYHSDQSMYWNYTFDSPFSAPNAVIGPDGSYIINHEQKKLVILSSTGSLLVSGIPQSVTASKIAVDAQGHFFLNINATEGNFGVFDSSGSLLWSKNVEWTGSAPVIVDNGVVLVTGDRRITAIQGYAGLSPSYARPRGDNKNTGRGNY